MAARQLPRRAGAHPRGAREPAARLLPRAAGAGRRPAGRLSARLRARDHADLAHRGADRPRRTSSGSSTRSRRSRRSRIGELWAMPAMLRLGLIENVRRMALRTVQRLDEIEAADAAAARGIARRREPASAALDAALDRLRRRPAAAHADVRLPLPAAAPRSRAARSPPLVLAGAVDRRGGAERGGGRRARHPAAGAHAGDDGEQHHQPARHRPDGLEDVRRAPERDGGGAARGSVRASTRAMTFATRDRYRHVVERIAQADAADRGGRGARRAVELRRAPARTRRPDDPRARARRATTWSTTGLAELERADRLPPALRRGGCTAGCGATPTWCSSAASLVGTLAALAARALARRARRRARRGSLVLLLGLHPGERHRASAS